jgi:uncharacterized membrane protein
VSSEKGLEEDLENDEVSDSDDAYGYDDVDADAADDSRRAFEAPSRTDRFVAGVSNLIGGPVGRHAGESAAPRFWTPMRIVLAITLAVLALAWLQKQPCADGRWTNNNQYTRACYTDVLALYGAEGLDKHRIPYVEKRTDDPSDPLQYVEYPVLTGAMMLIAALPVWLVTALLPDTINSQYTFFYQVNALLLALFAVLAVWAVVRMRSRRPFDAAMLAAAPAMVFTAFVNWDMLAVGLCTLALYAWARKNPAWAGVLLGLAAAAKFYPLFILGPLFLLCLRRRQILAFAKTAGLAVAAWIAVNLPVVFAAGVPAWSEFYRFSSQRAVDWGTFWYVGANLTGPGGGPLAALGNDIPTLNTVSGVIFALWCAGVALLIFMAPVPPRLSAVAFLVVAGFLLSGKVWSQQYVLWLIPLLVLARPRWGAFLVWQVCELGYFLAFYQTLLRAAGGKTQMPESVFLLASMARWGSVLMLCGFVVLDALEPWRDVVRTARDPDPDGGVLNDEPERYQSEEAGAAAPA